MTKQTILRNLIAIAICLAVNFNANAQINLNKLKDTAKEKAKDEAKEKATSVKSNEESKQETQQSEQPKKSDTKQTNKAPLKPGSAAIAADPKASDNIVANGFTKSYAGIRAAYENLPADVYFKPYYHPSLKNYYFLDPDQYTYLTGCCYLLNTAYRPHIRMTDGLKEDPDSFLGRYYSLPIQYRTFVRDTIPAGNKHANCATECTGYAVVGTHGIFAYFALFAADPKGFIPFEKFCEANVAAMFYTGALTPQDASTFSGYWDGRTITLADGNAGKLTLNWDKSLEFAKKELERLHEIALTVTPVEVLESAAANYYNKMQENLEENNYAMLRFNFHVFETAMFYWKFSKLRPKKANEDFDYLCEEHEKYLQMYPQWVDGERMGGAPIAMPKTYDMGADLAKKALDAAKSQFSDFTAEKVVFTSNQWREFKEQQYPYRVMHRSIPAAILYKNGDKWIIRFYELKQMSDQKGGWTQNYGFMAGGDANPKVVNYKP